MAEKKWGILERQARERHATSTGGKNPQIVEISSQAVQGKTRDALGASIGVSGVIRGLCDKMS